MNKSTIIRQMRKVFTLSGEVYNEQEKLNKYIDSIQGDPIQNECNHPSYGNGTHSRESNVCGTCFKFLTEEERTEY